MPNINYEALCWKSLDGTQADQSLVISYEIPVTRAELRSILDTNIATSSEGLSGLLKQKIHSAFLGTGRPCISCNGHATGMVNTISLHQEAPGGPTLVDHTPFPVCHSPGCIQRASRVAHEYRRYVSENNSMAAQCEVEVCDNCQVVRNVVENGRMKRCGRCKGKIYCSKQCQIEAWKAGQRLQCREP